MLSLLRQYFLPFSGIRPWLSYLGLLLLLLTLPISWYSRTLAYGLVILAYVLLLGLPFAMAPKVWRTLISNRQLVLVPGFARAATTAAFIFTWLQAIYLTGFAELFGLGNSHLQHTALLFINGSLYML
ncbi:MAG TPA: hypothetical protein VMH83_00065, partial [Candidatus Acidoferrum sp.]|nr:hypothetical protein [Candidatus Acidoferrum sp.]